MTPFRYFLLLGPICLSFSAGSASLTVTVQNQGLNIERGLEAFRRKEFGEAEQYFRQATRDNPKSALAHKLLGMALSAREDYRQALGPFQQACELDPGEENACYYLGRTYYSLNRFAEARGAFTIALSQWTPRGRPLSGLALTLEALGMPAEAEQRYKEAINVGEKQALIDYGMFLYKNGRGKESIEVLRKAGAQQELLKVMRSVSAAEVFSRKAGATEPVQFEVTPLDMVVNNGATGDKHLIETMIGGVALFDFDNDGWLDVFVSNGGESPGLKKPDSSYSNGLFRNLGGTRFANVSHKAGLSGEGYCMGVAAADFDNDGWTDLFVTGVRGNRLYRNRGNGTFADVTAEAGIVGDGSWSVAAGWFDYDNDGWLDLFVVHYVRWDPSTETYCGAGESGNRSYCHPKYYQSLPNALYRNMGNGTFRDVSVESGIAAHLGKGMGLAFGDFDLDGRMDVFVANDTVANFLFRNEGNGTFREVGLEAGVAYNTNGTAISSMGVDFRDIDNDGLEDIFVTALSNDMFPLFRNLGRGRFVDVAGPARIAAASQPWSGWGNGAYDFNNDGWKDLFTANGHALDNVELTSGRKARQPNTLFVNQGGAGFEVEGLPGQALHRGSAFGDIDRDGRMDVVVTRLNEPPVLLRNVSEKTGNWVRFLLRGRRSNRDAIGAFVAIDADSGKQWNRVTTSVGYGGSSELAVHFGLGAANRVNTAKIQWPSGTIQVLSDLRAGKVHEVVEPLKQ